MPASKTEDDAKVEAESARKVAHPPIPPVTPKATAPVTDPGLTATHYRIAHGAVGGHRQGETVPADRFSGSDTERLIALGAILPMYEPE